MNNTTTPQPAATEPLWSDDEFPWVNAELNSNSQLGIAARIISRWGKDWHRDGRDEATYASAYNDIADFADALTKQLAARATDQATIQQQQERIDALEDIVNGFYERENKAWREAVESDE